MEWTTSKPDQDGWYEYRGDLYPVSTGAAPTTCDPHCKVCLHSGYKPFITVYKDIEEYDYDKANGLWRGPIDPPDAR